jgi:hypothetical protein
MSNSKLAQNEETLKYMRENGSITPFEAMSEFGCMRLASRISDLRRNGHIIKDEWVVVKNRDGDKSRVKRYSLGETCDESVSV